MLHTNKLHQIHDSSLNTIVLNSRDQHKKHGILFVPPQQASQYILPKKPTEMHWLHYDNNVPSLNTMKILTSAIGREFLNPLVFGLPARLPTIKPSSTRSMAPEFSHNRGNYIRFTKPLFRLRFIHCTMAFLFILHYLSCSSFIRYLCMKISKEGVD